MEGLVLRRVGLIAIGGTKSRSIEGSKVLKDAACYSYFASPFMSPSHSLLAPPMFSHGWRLTTHDAHFHLARALLSVCPNSERLDDASILWAVRVPWGPHDFSSTRDT